MHVAFLVAFRHFDFRNADDECEKCMYICTFVLYLPIRVTRLGEFSPIGRLFTLGTFLKNSSPKFWDFFNGKNYV
jgi:hypothetical protein